jgi:hypothetical protein
MLPSSPPPLLPPSSCAQTTHQRHPTYTISMAATFVAPRTLRDVPHSESYPPGHPALVIPATPEFPSYEVSYTALAHAVATVGKQLIPLLPAEKSEKVRQGRGREWIPLPLPRLDLPILPPALPPSFSPFLPLFRWWR